MGRKANYLCNKCGEAKFPGQRCRPCHREYMRIRAKDPEVIYRNALAVKKYQGTDKGKDVMAKAKSKYYSKTVVIR